MSGTAPQAPGQDPDGAPLDDVDPGEDRGALPGTDADAADDPPDPTPGEDPGGPDTQLAPTRD